MKSNSGYVITEQNIDVISVISGMDKKTLHANIGWALIYQEDPYPRWSLMPKNAALSLNNFTWVDSPLNGLPTRSEKAIRQEWARFTEEYATAIENLRQELDRARLQSGDDANGSRTVE